jgi:hypothetical protein
LRRSFGEEEGLGFREEGVVERRKEKGGEEEAERKKKKGREDGIWSVRDAF